VTLPGPIRKEVEAALAAAAGHPDSIARTRPVGGGCVSPTARVETTGGAVLFLKTGAPGLPGDMLGAEARGLRALAASDAVRVPAVVASGGEGARAWLLLEWLEPGRPHAGSWATLGTGLAALHRARAARFGAEHDNYIGPLPQSNGRLESWPDFWRDRRLAPQLAAAVRRGHLGERDMRRFASLFARLDDLLAPAAEDGASLVHGDLWNGNVHITHGGVPALIDPSAYHGHREVDLAMAELFGGFAPPFRQAYEEAWPLAPGYEPFRRAIYQLYYLLVHINLFGSGYVAGTRRALDSAGF
jgi:protein-ribulosamine 3-kinase